jgi:type IV secretion system protein VirD4
VPDPLPGQGADQWAAAIVAPAKQTEDPDNAGVRREPELPEHEEIVSEPRKPAQEFELADDDPQVAAQDHPVLQRRTRTLARQVALDPGDDMSL